MGETSDKVARVKMPSQTSCGGHDHACIRSPSDNGARVSIPGSRLTSDTGEAPLQVNMAAPFTTENTNSRLLIPRWLLHKLLMGVPRDDGADDRRYKHIWHRRRDDAL